MKDEADFVLPPLPTNTFALPREPELLRVWEIYKPSLQTKKLFSENGREIFAEAFIEHPNLGSLSDLCVRALAKLGTRYIAPMVRDSPLNLRIHYDALDVDLPLEDCYFVDDLCFWRRVVQQKSKDATLLMKKDNEFDWKGKGISMKYVELVEACPAEFWQEQKMFQLAALVKSYVKELHIKKLQSLKDRSFEHYFESESDTESSDASEPFEISSDEITSSDGDLLYEEEEEIEEQKSQMKMQASEVVVNVNNFGDLPQARSTLSTIVTQYQKNERRRARHGRNVERQALREEQAKSKEAREERRLKRELKRKKHSEREPEIKKKRRKRKIKGVFDIVVESEPDDGEDEIPDRRNKQKLMRRFKRYKYPPEHCHHIDLSFVRYFDELTSISLEFLGPDMGRDYHTRHMNFSYDDMARFARGLKSLTKLQKFRLRNSRMDTKKFQVLTRVLKYIETLEVIDFGYDNLKDDCATSLGSLFEYIKKLDVLELEHNCLGAESMEVLGSALQRDDCASLRYLGLAHNPLTDAGLQSLCNAIVGRSSVETLNLTSIECTKEGIVYCVASRLLRLHRPLKSINISGIPLGYMGRELVKALVKNTNILEFECRGCDFDEDAEYETSLMLRRNNYLRQHPYVGNAAVTEQEIKEFLSRRKHPLIVKLLQEIEQHEECIKNRPVKSPSVISLSVEEEEEVQDIWAKYGIPQLTMHAPTTIIESSSSTTDEVPATPFVYNPNEFTEAELREYIFQPGLPNRYYYFQQNKDAL